MRRSETEATSATEMARKSSTAATGRGAQRAAKVAGTPPGRIIRKELLPNLVTPMLVQATYMLPNNVTAIAGLSFLGVGMLEPTPDWGRMFATGAEVYQSDITYMFFPGGAMVIFILAFNLLGDSVRDAFDPKSGR